jgi:hypothetical protein
LCVRSCCIVLFIATASVAYAHDCRVEKAVYRAANTAWIDPDELRFDFRSEAPLPFKGPRAIRVKSPEMGREWVLDTHFTNGSTIQGVATRIPEAQLPEHMREERRSARAARERSRLTGEPQRKGGPAIYGDYSLSSMTWVVTAEHEVSHLPLKGQPAPQLVLFPDFRPLAHARHAGLVSAGLVWGVFRFDRCE